MIVSQVGKAALMTDYLSKHHGSVRKKMAG
jgi:hypothetical protein